MQKHRKDGPSRRTPRCTARVAGKPAITVLTRTLGFTDLSAALCEPTAIAEQEETDFPLAGTSLTVH